jgi:hypothetical protein
MKMLAKALIFLILSISLILQGCSQVISTNRYRGNLISTEKGNSPEELSRDTKIELVSPTSVKIKNIVNYGNPVVNRYEKIENKYIGTSDAGPTILGETLILPIRVGVILPLSLVCCVLKPSGCPEVMEKAFSPIFDCKKEKFRKNCTFSTEKTILPDEFEEETFYENIHTLEEPVSRGMVNVSVCEGSQTLFQNQISLASDGSAVLDITSFIDKLPVGEAVKVIYQYGQIEETALLTKADVQRALASRIPPSLIIDRKISFAGDLQGGILEGEQDGKILVTLSNKGKGNAFGVKLAVAGNYPGVHIPPIIDVGDISPGTSREVAIPVTADLDVQSGSLALSFQAKEQFGKDSVPLKMQPGIVIRQIETPQLEIGAISYNDTGSLASGNGNGVPENGETVEIRTKIRNNGEGFAKGVVLRFTDLPEGIQPVKTSIQLGNIPPGGTIEGALAIKISKLFRSTGKDIPINLTVEDSRPIGKPTRKELALPYHYNESILRIADLEIYDGDPGTSSTGNRNHLMDQGEQVEVRTYVENVGTMPAEDVSVSLKTDRPISQVTIFPASFYLGKIEPGEKKLAATFTVDLSGSATPGAIKMEVMVTQKDFEKQYAGYNHTVFETTYIASQPDSLPKPGKNAVSKLLSAPLNIDEVPHIGNFLRPNNYALLIGIGRYKRSDVNPLPYAESDVRAVKNYLVNIGGIPKENVTVLTNENATLSGIKEQFEKLTRRSKADSEVFVFFSCHGVPEMEKKKPYLLPYDGNPDTISSTGFAVSEMKKIISDLPTKRVLVAIDACFTGQGRSVVAKEMKGVAWVEKEETPTDALVITASNEEQAAWDWPDKAHGIFTYYFLEGLRGAAASKRNDGFVYADELYEYVVKQVPSTSKEKYGVIQSPVKQGNVKDFCLTKRIQ